MDTLHYDYKSVCKSTLSKVLERKQEKTFTFEEHLSALIFSQLSNQRPWKPIADNHDNLMKIFRNFDANYLKSVDSNDLISSITELKCGNRQIRKQMNCLKDNIITLEKIVSDYGSLDNYYNFTDTYTILTSLSSGKYKIKLMGLALVSEYLKGMGVDIVKPDVHVCRILGRLGYTKNNPGKAKEAMAVCHDIAKEYGMFDVEVDSILWQFCANGYFQQCTNKPNCKNCLVKHCKK